MHQASVSKHENAVKSLNELYKNNSIRQLMAGRGTATNHSMQKLVDISRVIPKEEILFMKFPKLIELELHYGIDLGQSVSNGRPDIL